MTTYLDFKLFEYLQSSFHCVKFNFFSAAFQLYLKFCSGFPHSIESVEKVLNFEISFSRHCKSIEFGQNVHKILKSMEIPESIICLFKVCSSPLVMVL